MKLTFLGAARTVTGSQHLIEVNGHRILLDCGLHQGKRKEAFERNRRCIPDGSSIDLLILSHAHIDHSGSTPCLVKNGFQGDILCTPATRDLCAMMLLDSAHIQESDVEYVNKKRRKQGKRLFEPLYRKDDVAAAMRLFTSLPYDRRRTVFPGVEVTFVDAGHMLGSSGVVLEIEDEDAKREVRLVFSGDIGHPGIPIIRDPVPIKDGADLLIMESTYGNRHHPPDPDTEKELERIVTATFARGGSVLIPAFAVGRTQQIVYTLHKLHRRGGIPAMPIFVDSPLATGVTEVYRLHPEVYDEETRAFLLGPPERDPFGFSALHYTRSVGESKRLNDLRQPSIIISASGMMEAGRILHHLKNRIEDPRNTILITGWQAPHTLGRRIVEKSRLVPILGENYPLEAQVEVLNGLSGHADREGLIRWASAMERKPERTFVIHGEEEAAAALAGGLRSELGFRRVDVPEMHETFAV